MYNVISNGTQLMGFIPAPHKKEAAHWKLFRFFVSVSLKHTQNIPKPSSTVLAGKQVRPLETL